MNIGLIINQYRLDIETNQLQSNYITKFTTRFRPIYGDVHINDKCVINSLIMTSTEICKFQSVK